MSRFDRIYRRSLLSKIFVNGWGNPDLLLRIIENHKIVSKRETCKNLVKSFNVVTNKIKETSTTITMEGQFMSPFHELLPGCMDENNRIARFQLIVPKTWDTKYRPLCIHYPGTGDHQYSRRKLFLANRLLKDGIASLIHINPYYGNRKPKNQRGSALNYLSDLFVVGGALILETQVLLRWAEQEMFYPLAVHGISMGGHMACLGASVYEKPVCLIPCLSWTTASHVFTQGAMSSSVSWDVLSKQFNNDDVYKTKIRDAIEPPIPLHIKNIIKSNQLNTKSNVIHQENKLKTPFDNLERKFHFMIPRKDNLDFVRRNLTNDENSTDSQKRSRFVNLRKTLGTFSWNRPLELFSFMRSVTQDDNITNEELENINKSETEMKHKQTKENYFFRSINVDKETIDFMRDILDFFTHLSNYSIPCDTRLATIVVAGNDAYIPIEGVAHFHDIWDSQCEVRIRKGVGHVEAYLRNSVWTEDAFRIGIVDTMNRYVELYHEESGPFGQKKS